MNMDNVEGDYREIIAWIDETKPFVGVQWSYAHGAPVEDEEGGRVYDEDGFAVKFNVGLFSLRNLDEVSEPAEVDFSVKEFYMPGGWPISVENPDTSHLITF
jgi:hypothetical protein